MYFIVIVIVISLSLCYLARARAMARVVLAQIEFMRAICGSRKILSMLQYNVIFLHSKRKMHEITAADSGLYIVGHYTDHNILRKSAIISLI